MSALSLASPGICETSGDMRWIAASSEILSKKYASGRLVVRRLFKPDSAPELSERALRVMGTCEHGSREAAASISPAWAKAS